MRLKIKRWWEIRTKMLGGLWDATLNIVMTLSVHLGTSYDSLKRKLLRYGLLSHALIYKTIQLVMILTNHLNPIMLNQVIRLIKAIDLE